MNCTLCGDDVDELHTAKVNGKRRRVCEDCLDRVREQEEIDDAALDAMGDMMGYRGRGK